MSTVAIQVSLAALASRETSPLICDQSVSGFSWVMSGPNRSLRSWSIERRAAFVSAARAALNSVSCLSDSPVCAKGPSDWRPRALANTIVRIAPAATVRTPMSPNTAAVVRTSAGASPRGVSTGIDIASATCSGDISRNQM